MKTINNNIKEKWVSFDNAKLLDNKGLELGSRQAYDLLENLSTPHYGDIYFNGISNGDCSFEAPTQQLAIDWILKNYNMWIHVAPENNEEDIVTWRVTIQKIDTEVRFVRTFGQYSTPEEAKEAAITYVLTTMI